MGHQGTLGIVTEAEADRYAARCRDALDGLVDVYRSLPERPALERPSRRAGVSVRDPVERQHTQTNPVMRSATTSGRWRAGG